MSPHADSFTGGKEIGPRLRFGVPRLLARLTIHRSSLIVGEGVYALLPPSKTMLGT